jgi:protein-disulfide isomerase/uncharacterized membrane protein
MGIFFPAVAWGAEGDSGMVVLGGLTVLLVVVLGLVVAARPMGLLASGIAGTGISMYLAYEHTQAGKAICDISSSISCSAVNSSEYSTLFGIPVAILGLGYFLAISWLAARYLMVKKGNALLLIQLGGVLAVGFDIYLGWAMRQVGAFCPFCAATYVLNLFLLVGSTLEKNRLDQEKDPINLASALGSEGLNATVIGLVGLVVGVMAFGGTAKGSSSGTPGMPLTADELRGMYEQPAGPIRIDPNDPFKGNPDAKYVLVEWADFQCPHCAISFPDLKKLAEQNQDIKLYYKNYPISNGCNRFVEREGHADACRAAAAGVCAHAQSSFWPLAEAMFKNQQYLSKDDIRFMVQQSGIDSTAFEACMQDPATEAAVKEDVEGGGLAKINGTPSIFLKGVFGDQWIKVNGHAEEIEAILKVARAGGQLPDPPAPSGK